MDDYNTIKAHHFKVVKGVFRIGAKEYYWHIPESLRAEKIKKGDMLLAATEFGDRKVVVVDVLNEPINEDPEKRRKNVVRKLNPEDNI